MIKLNYSNLLIVINNKNNILTTKDKMKSSIIVDDNKIVSNKKINTLSSVGYSSSSYTNKYKSKTGSNSNMNIQ